MKASETLALEKKNQRTYARRTRQLKKKLETGEIKIKDGKTKKEPRFKSRGLIYVGHIPHGFYESEMKKYFTQFGAVTNVIVCRSSTTGKSKGYGYVEFMHSEVGKVAAETMNNYLMFQRRLVVSYVEPNVRPKKLFVTKVTNPLRLTLRNRQLRQNASKNKEIDSETFQEQTKLRLRKLTRRLAKLEKLGIKHQLEPEVNNENAAASDTIKDHTYMTLSDDSDIEIKISVNSKDKLKNISNRITGLHSKVEKEQSSQNLEKVHRKLSPRQKKSIEKVSQLKVGSLTKTRSSTVGVDENKQRASLGNRRSLNQTIPNAPMAKGIPTVKKSASLSIKTSDKKLHTKQNKTETKEKEVKQSIKKETRIIRKGRSLKPKMKSNKKL